MKKEILNRKIELFKENFPDWTLSKNDNLVWSDDSRTIKTKSVNSYSVTKNSLSSFGKNRIYTESAGITLLLKKTGSLCYIQKGVYKKVTPAALSKQLSTQYAGPVQNKLAPIFFVGKKFEWMLQYPKLWRMRYFQSFSSLEEAKTYLGYGSLSDNSFVQLFETFEVAQLVFRLHTKGERFLTLYLLNNRDSRIIKNLTRYLDLCEEMGHEPEVPIDEGTLAKLVAQKEKESKDAVFYSDERVYYSSKMFDFWNEMGLDYVVADSHRSMFKLHNEYWWGKQRSSSDMESVIYIGIKEGKKYTPLYFTLKGECAYGRLDERFRKKEPFTISKDPIITNYKRID